jgi:plasmid stability protein
MDIHMPEPVHSWRDVFIHLGIITLGLFIALSLEGVVEYFHHRHIVAEARANIRQELETDHVAAQRDLTLLQQGIDLQKKNIQNIHNLEEQPHFHGSISNTMDFDSMDDAAWQTARDTGALAFMPYQEVQRYSDLYMLEEQVNAMAIEDGKADFEAAAPFDMGINPDKLPPAEFQRMLHDNAAVEIQFLTLKQFVQQFDNQCVAALKQ